MVLLLVLAVVSQALSALFFWLWMERIHRDLLDLTDAVRDLDPPAVEGDDGEFWCEHCQDYHRPEGGEEGEGEPDGGE